MTNKKRGIWLLPRNGAPRPDWRSNVLLVVTVFGLILYLVETAPDCMLKITMVCVQRKSFARLICYRNCKLLLIALQLNGKL